MAGVSSHLHGRRVILVKRGKASWWYPYRSPEDTWAAMIHKSDEPVIRDASRFIDPGLILNR